MIFSSDLSKESLRFGRLSIWCFHLSLLYVTVILLLPAYLSISPFTSMVSKILNIVIPTPTASLHDVHITGSFSLDHCMIFTSFSIALFGNSLLQPNYAMTPKVSIWSVLGTN